jgi:hypothetical protein
MTEEVMGKSTFSSSLFYTRAVFFSLLESRERERERESCGKCKFKNLNSKKK